MEKLFTVQNDFADTVTRYVSREMGKGKDPIRTMNRLMTYWLLNAMKNVTGPKSSRGQIRAYLMRKINDSPMPATRRKRAAVVDEMRNTVAMLIAAKYNFKGFRTAKGSQGYKIARQLRNNAEFSSGYIKSGFLPALRVRRSNGDGSQTPRYKNLPGDAPPTMQTPNEITMMATNFASVVGELFPDAFDKGASELNGIVSKWLHEDMLTEQAKAGLSAQRA